MSCNCKKSTSQCEFDKFPEYYNRLQYVEDTILKLISEMFEDDHPQDRSDEYLDRADPSEIPLYHLDLEELNKLEIEQIRRLIARLARKLASRYSLRYKRAKHGSVRSAQDNAACILLQWRGSGETGIQKTYYLPPGDYSDL